MKSKSLACIVLLCASILCSCQKVALDDEETPTVGKQAVTFRVAEFEQQPFTMRSQDIAALCSHINLAIYSGSERVESKSQTTADKDFGTMSLQLAAGTYRAVILAHSQDRSPTTTNAEKIAFNGDMDDTFLWTETLTVEEGKGQSVDASMKRAVAMVRIATTDNIPDNVASVQFYYTGGSSTINALTGKGCVNSKQKFTRTVTADMKGKPASFDLYTFPKGDENLLKIEVTALDDAGQTVAKRTFEGVPIERNQITLYKGALFTDGGDDDTQSKFKMTTDDEWSTVEKTF